MPLKQRVESEHTRRPTCCMSSLRDDAHHGVVAREVLRIERRVQLIALDEERPADGHGRAASPPALFDAPDCRWSRRCAEPCLSGTRCPCMAFAPMRPRERIVHRRIAVAERGQAASGGRPGCGTGCSMRGSRRTLRAGAAPRTVRTPGGDGECANSTRSRGHDHHRRCHPNHRLVDHRIPELAGALFSRNRS